MQVVFQDEKSIVSIILTVSILISLFFASAAEVPSELATCYATDESRAIVENLMGDIFTEVQNDLGYANARAKLNVIIFNARLNRQTNG